MHVIRIQVPPRVILGGSMFHIVTIYKTGVIFLEMNIDDMVVGMRGMEYIWIYIPECAYCPGKKQQADDQPGIWK